VIAVPDARKGEKLLLITTRRDAGSRALLAAAHERGTAEIQVPRDVLVVDRMPLLAAGKIDYPAVQRLVEAKAERPEVATVA
jgi:acyl-[acyl-carrier-protein]-phospholipid O-acyltransferase/long-chain-fatty-acid--[acyl-carrier-protein] ligase